MIRRSLTSLLPAISLSFSFNLLTSTTRTIHSTNNIIHFARAFSTVSQSSYSFQQLDPSQQKPYRNFFISPDSIFIMPIRTRSMSRNASSDSNPTPQTSTSSSESNTNKKTARKKLVKKEEQPQQPTQAKAQPEPEPSFNEKLKRIEKAQIQHINETKGTRSSKRTRTQSRSGGTIKRLIPKSPVVKKQKQNASVASANTITPSKNVTSKYFKNKKQKQENTKSSSEAGSVTPSPVTLPKSMTPPASPAPPQPSNNDNTNSMSTPNRNQSTPKSNTKAKKTTSSSARKRIRIEPHSLPLPSDFHKIYNIVVELRNEQNAPVDSDGAEALPETDHGDKVYRFQVLIALMLSSQTKDAVVGDTMRALQKHGLNVPNIHSHTSQEKVNQLIQKVGFHNNKAKYIKQTCEILMDQYDGDIPPTADLMMKLPGVGPKMAYIIESIAWDKQTGIGVDTHMHRIFNQLKWVKSSTPEQTREQLEGFLPIEYWKEWNYLFVGLGQQVQQQKDVILKKAFSCSQPMQALGLLKKLGMDTKKEAKRYGLEEELKAAMNPSK